MLTAKDARELSEQREMEISGTSETRRIERQIKEACERGKRECSIFEDDSYLWNSRKGDAIIRYLRSQGYEVDVDHMVKYGFSMKIKW